MDDMKGIWIVKLTVNQGIWENLTNAFNINFTNMLLQIKEGFFFPLSLLKYYFSDIFHSSKQKAGDIWWEP